MKNRASIVPVTLALSLIFNLQPTPALAQGTAFTYQGSLSDGGAPANGTNYGMVFYLYDTPTGGNLLGNEGIVSVTVSNGLFTVPLSFGNVFDGTPRWLEISVQKNGGGFTTLAPRQQLTPAPYAIFAETSSNLNGTMSASQLTGTVGNNQLANNSLTVTAGTGLSGGGAVALGGSTTLNNAGVTSLTGGGGVTVSAASGAVTLGSTATSADTANAIVSRDASGNFAVGSLTLAGTLTLPALPDNVYSGFTQLLNADTNQDFFVGPGSGPNVNGSYADTGVGYDALNLSTGGYNTGVGALALFNNFGGSNNTANGYQTLYNNTSGSENTAVGAYALNSNTNGIHNTANGYHALYSNTGGSENTASGRAALVSNISGTENTADGSQALDSNTNGNHNTASGYAALYNSTSGSDNTANGYEALFFSATGSDNTANGFEALLNLTNGNYNTADGMDALRALTTGDQNMAAGADSFGFLTVGTHNTALGYEAGLNVTSGTNNIEIGTGGAGADNQTIRIGNGQTNTFIAGIFGATAASGAAVYVNSSGQLGTLTSSARYKQNIHSMGEASDVLLALHPVTFQYKPGIDPAGTPQFGLVAEQVEKVDPDLVVRDTDGSPYTVRYQAVDAMLLNEFLKEHQTVEAQGAEIQRLKEQLNQLEQFIKSKNGDGK